MAAGSPLYHVHLPPADEGAAWLLSFNLSVPVPEGRWFGSREMDLFHELWGDVISHIDGSDGRVELMIHPEDDAYAAVEDLLGRGATKMINHEGFKLVRALADTLIASFCDLISLALRSAPP